MEAPRGFHCCEIDRRGLSPRATAVFAHDLRLSNRALMKKSGSLESYSPGSPPLDPPLIDGSIVVILHRGGELFMKPLSSLDMLSTLEGYDDDDE